jgi:flagellar hook-basal body complex protein FliE
MVERIGRDNALAREALQAALRHAGERPAPAHAGAGASEPSFAGVLDGGIDKIEQQVNVAESMPIDLLTGRIDDFHEIAVQLKSAELSFKFAMEIRNKLIDAYREIMRMSV